MNVVIAKTETKIKTIKTRKLVFLVFLVIFFGFNFAAADDGEKVDLSNFKPVISEIMYSHPSSNDLDWIEVKNNSKTGIILNSVGSSKEYGQKLPIRICKDKNCKSTNLIYFSNKKDKIEIGPGEFFIIAKDKNVFIDRYCGNGKKLSVQFCDEKVLASSFSLAGGSDKFIGIFIETKYIKDYKGNEDEKYFPLEGIIYESSWGGDKNGKALERIKLDKDGKGGNWKESLKCEGTPGEDNDKGNNVKYSKEIAINEILPEPNEGNEWIELLNIGKEDIDLSCWKLRDKTKTPYVFFDQKIEAGKFLVVEDEINLNKYGGEVVSLFNPQDDENPVSRVEYEKIPNLGWSLARTKKGKYEWTNIITREAENKFPIPVQYSSEVFFNEVLPNPDGADKGGEWVELYNGDDEKIDLNGWWLENRSGKKYVLEKIIIERGGLGVAKIKNSSFSIRNSNEVLKLINPNGELVGQVSFIESAKSGISFNKDKNGKWLWGRFLTPGKENIFNNLPRIEIEKDKEIFKNIRAYFNAGKTSDEDGDELKFKWDFGDGHRSYLAETSHIFEKEGVYEIVLTVNDGSGEALKRMKAEVGSFPERDLEIVGLMPNPRGSDLEGEFIEIRNNYKKSIDLGGYFLATGKNEENLVNHPVSGSFKIQPGSVGRVERDVCKFTLPNKEGTVALRYPNKKNADKVSYSKEEIREEEKYALINGKWAWIPPASQEKEDETQTAAAFDSTAGGKADFLKIKFMDLAENKNKALCQCLVQVMVENWFAKNERWLKFTASSG